MVSVVKSHRLRCEIETQECQLTEDLWNRIQGFIDRIAAAVLEFPQPQLWLTIVYHLDSRRYHAQAKLRLLGRTIITGADDEYLDSACEQCAARVVEYVDIYNSNLDDEALGHAEESHSLSNDVIAPADPDVGQLGEAFQRADYASFRRALLGHEEWLRMRVDRWIQRYSLIDEGIGGEYEIADLVEAVFVMAFEQYRQRSLDKSISQWLEDLIDSAIRKFHKSDAEREAVRHMTSLAELNRQ